MATVNLLWPPQKTTNRSVDGMRTNLFPEARR